MLSLLQHGFNVNAKHHEHATALTLAARNRHLNAVNLITQNEADVDLHGAEDCGKSALHNAVWNGHIEIVHALLQV